jgi:hypothetical protein
MSAIANEVEALVETGEKFITQAAPGPATQAELTEIFCRRRDAMISVLRSRVGDAKFNPASPKQVHEVLFGDPEGAPIAPSGRQLLRLGHRPVKATGKGGKSWDLVKQHGDAAWLKGGGWVSSHLSPSTDADTLAVLADE